MIKPLENVLDQFKCTCTSPLKKEVGILVVTTARVLFKSDNSFNLMLQRQGIKKGLTADRAHKESFWVIRIRDEFDTAYLFRFYGPTSDI
jgi:hypothetical protein